MDYIHAKRIGALGAFYCFHFVILLNASVRDITLRDNIKRDVNRMRQQAAGADISCHDNAISLIFKKIPSWSSYPVCTDIFTTLANVLARPDPLYRCRKNITRDWFYSASK